ncbi:MAG: hypothetical protein HYR76_01205 [Ignavibacteria bacterium]|nr:hypothetical protein [Ignavibacteria bacterium]
MNETKSKHELDSFPELTKVTRENRGMTVGVVIGCAFATAVPLVHDLSIVEVPSPEGVLVKAAIVSIIVVILAAQSLRFYFKILRRMRENIRGTIFSVGLLIAQLGLLGVNVFSRPRFLLVGIGIVCIATKSVQLYFDSKTEGYGKNAVKYFEKILIVYSCVSLLILWLSWKVDGGKMLAFSKEQASSVYNAASGTIDQIIAQDSSAIAKDSSAVVSLKKEVKLLYGGWTEATDNNNTLSYGVIFIGLLLAIYTAYQEVLMKHLSFHDVLVDLNEYAKSNPKENGDD